MESGLADTGLPAFLDSSLQRAGWVHTSGPRAPRPERAPAADRTWAEIRDLVKGAAVLVNLELPSLEASETRGHFPGSHYVVAKRDDDRAWAFKEAVREALGLGWPRRM